MDKRVDNRITRTSGMNTWRAGCSGSCTSGSEGGPQKPTRRKPDRALRSDPYSKMTVVHSPVGTLINAAQLTGLGNWRNLAKAWRDVLIRAGATAA